MLRAIDSTTTLAVCLSILGIILTVTGPGCGMEVVPDLGFFGDAGGVTPPLGDARDEPFDQWLEDNAELEDSAEPDDPDPDETPPADDVPENAYCNPVADWDDLWTSFEEEVLDLVNRRRAAGADCGETGTFDPAGPLTMSPALRCAARNHSMDMGTRDYFAHDTPEGLGPGDRIDQAGYTGSMWAENIAWGYATPEAVVSGWMSSPGHCANIMHPELTETGIGFYEGNLWTETFGRP